MRAQPVSRWKRHCSNALAQQGSPALTAAMTSEWTEACLGDCFALVRDKADPAAFNPAAPYVGLENITPGSPRLGPVGQVGAVTSLVSAFQPGDVLFGRL